MKILHLIQKPQHRGAETFTCQLAKHQKNLGMQVKIAGIFNGNASLDWDDEIINLEGNPSARFIDYKAWKNLNKLIKDFQPDIVQANAGDTLKYAVFSKKAFRWTTPIISRNASEVGRYLKSGIQKKLNAFLYRNVAQVLSVSQASQKDILSLFPFLKAKTIVIPIGLEEKEPRILELQPKGVAHIVHIGGFSFEKNHKGLLDIFQLVLQQQPNVHLHLVGDGPLRQETETLVKKANLDDKTTFHGFVNNPLDFNKAADVLMLPSIIEGLPGVLLEAMYCKTPVVAYNVGGISEIIANETGSLIPKGDERAFAAAVLRTLEKPDQQQIENAYKMVVENCMNVKIVEKFVKAYGRVVD